MICFFLTVYLKVQTFKMYYCSFLKLICFLGSNGIQGTFGGRSLTKCKEVLLLDGIVRTLHHCLNTDWARSKGKTNSRVIENIYELDDHRGGVICKRLYNSLFIA